MVEKLPDSKDYHVYNFHFLDGLTFVERPESAFASDAKGKLDDHIAAVKALFKTAGWEGDGELGIIWLPPFTLAGGGDTWGLYVGHVKQSNNGTSWLASPDELEFESLEKMNRS